MGLKIGWLGTSVSASTGYGKISAQIIERLLDRYEVVSLAHLSDVVIWGGVGTQKLPNGKEVLTLPYQNPQIDSSAASKMVGYYAKKYEIDLVIGFWDLLALKWLNQIGLPFCDYCPIDGEVTKEWMSYTEDAMKVILYSKFGYDQVSKFLPKSQIEYIEHGVDTELFKPLDKDKGDLREAMDSTTPIPKEAFLMSTVQANYTDRKKLMLLLRTFSRFAKLHKDAHLYVVTNARAWTGKGYDLEKHIRTLGVADRIHFPSYDPSLVPLTDQALNEALNATNLYVSSSEGEGFGVPLIESQSAGTPVLCPRNSSQTELVEGHGFIAENVPEEAYVDYPIYLPYGNWYPVCDQRSLLEKMEDAYKYRVQLEDYGRAAREFALQYDWDQCVMKKWFKLLGDLESEIEMWQSVLK